MGHCKQDEDPAVLYDPSGQMKGQEEDPVTLLKMPPGQKEHEDWPSWSAKEPGEQERHVEGEEAPDKLLKVPMGHGLAKPSGEVAPVMLDHVPCAHAKHAVIRDWLP